MDIIYDQQIFVSHRYGGIARYVCEVASRVHRHSGLSTRVIAPLFINEFLREHGGRGLPVAGLYVRRLPKIGPALRFTSALLAQNVIRRTRPAVMHATYYSPMSKLPPATKLVVTVHDLTEEILPEFSHYVEQRRRKAEAVHTADRLICVSHNTRRDLCRILSVNEEKITVIPLATAFSRVDVPDAKVPYLLFVGPRYAYKNFDRLLQAYSSSRVLMDSFRLVCFGAGRLTEREQERISSLGIPARSVTWLGGDDAALARCYSGAAALIYPSRYEGFGIPLLEAMACGCPVVCSRSSSLPEVAGDAAAYFDPNDTEDMRTALERVVLSAEATRRLRAAGYERVRMFSWEKCAEATARVYRSLM